MARGALALVLAAAACGGKRAEAPAVVVEASPARGAPHRAEIIAAAATRAGDTAVTLDVGGGARLWTALDGRVPPRRLELTGGTSPGIARAGDLVLVTAILPGGLGYLGRHRASGGGAGEVVIDPVDGEVIAIAPTHDAATAVVARADQSLELYDADGARGGRVVLGGERLRALAALGDDGVLAVLRRRDDTFVARRYRPHLGALVAAGEVTLLWRPADGAAIAISHDGARLAYQSETRGDRGAWVASGRYHVVEVTTGADVTPADLVDEVADRAAFTADGELHLDSVDARDRSDDFTLTGRSLLGVDLPLLAAAGDVQIGAVGSTLAVKRGSGPIRFLGYRLDTIDRFALSPGGRALVVERAGQLAVEALDGSAADRSFDAPARAARPDFVAFLDEGRLLVADGARRTAAIVDATDGRELASAPLPDRARHLALDPRRRWLFGVRDGGWFALALDVTRHDVFGDYHAIDGPAERVAPIAGDDAAGTAAIVSVVAADGVRDYTAADLRGGDAPPARAIVRGELLGGDEHGRWYWRDDASVAYATPADARGVIALRDPDVAITPLPSGGVLASDLASPRRTAYALDGHVMWTTLVGPASRSTSADLEATPDGRVLALGEPEGIALVDARTGEPLHASCDWSFGAWPDLRTDLRDQSLCDP